MHCVFKNVLLINIKKKNKPACQALILEEILLYVFGLSVDGAVEERSPPTNMARVRFPESASYVG